MNERMTDWLSDWLCECLRIGCGGGDGSGSGDNDFKTSGMFVLTANMSRYTYTFAS